LLDGEFFWSGLLRDLSGSLDRQREAKAEEHRGS
jgi:hypothetical protein